MLTREERQKLVGIIADLYDFTDEGPRGRRILIEQANLSRFLRGMNLAGAPITVAGDFIGRVEDFGYLPENPTYHALGALLSYVLTLGDLPLDQSHFLAELIVRYSLVADPLYVDKLRSNYGITATEIQPSTSTPTPPFIMPKSSDVPTLNVELQNEPGLERIISTTDNFLDIYLLAGAIYSAQAVCRIENFEGRPLGTGLLIGPDLLLTNQHVLKNRDYIGETIARFDYRTDASNVAQIGRVFKLQPEFYFSSDMTELDYALVRLQDQPLKHILLSGGTNGLTYLDFVLQGKHRGYLVLTGHFIKEYDRVNIIQHPNGNPMKVVLTQNYVVADMTKTRVQYVADTMEGSSGSPVFNQNWEVVALHHSGAPYPPESLTDTLKKSWKGHFRVNEGIPIRALLEDFRAKGINRYLPRV